MLKKWIGGYIKLTNLKFDDIDDWTPSSISIVDEPSHPCCHFEVYHDDEEYVKKSIEINEGEMMVEQNPQKEEPMVHAPVSFFEKLLGRTVGKAVEEEAPVKPPVKEEKADTSSIEARLEKLEARVAELEKQEPAKKEDEKEKEPAPGAVTKSEGESSEAETTTTETQEEIIDTEEVVAKSKSIDPDTAITSRSSETKSLVERAGRKTNGMTW